MQDLELFQKKTGYRFQNPDLLCQALTHRSYANEAKPQQHADNERLEFLGDAVLEIVTSDILFHRYPDWPEGKLTQLRASIVCEKTLALCCERMDFGKWILLGKGEEHTGGRKRPSILSDAMEAVIGAIYLDGGIGPAREYIERFIMKDLESVQLFHDSKSLLQELVQSQNNGSLLYEQVAVSGPDHARSYTVEARIGGKPYGRGTAHTKKAAEQEAAYQTLLLLRPNSNKQEIE